MRQPIVVFHPLPQAQAPVIHAIATGSNSSPQPVRKRQALDVPQKSASRARPWCIWNLERASAASRRCRRRKWPRLPAPTKEARNPAKGSNLTGEEADKPEVNPTTGEEILHHLAKAEETDLQSASPSTPPRTPKQKTCTRIFSDFSITL